MTDLAKGLQDERTAVADAVALLSHYSFDLGNAAPSQLVDQWLKNYPAVWIRWAVIEALYQGRYKAVSAAQILELWDRRQQPCYHFSYEFERLVCHRFPRNLSHSAPRHRLTNATGGTESAVLPALPAANRSPTATPAPSSEPPAWAALAEQIQHTDASEDLLGDSELEISCDQHDLNPHHFYEATPDQVDFSAAGMEPIAQSAPLDSLDSFEISAQSLVGSSDQSEMLENQSRGSRMQSGVESLIEKAASELNASAEAIRTRLRSEEYEPLSVMTQPSLFDEIHPPIHQFTPVQGSSDFHSKLKAVLELEPLDER